MTNKETNPKEKQSTEDTQQPSKRLSKRTKTLFILLVFVMVGLIITSIFTSNLLNPQTLTEEQSKQAVSENNQAKADGSLTRGTFKRPDYNTLDFYTALQSLGHELDFLYQDLTDYYTKGDKIGKTLQDLKDDRQFIMETLDLVVQKDLNDPNSKLAGQSIQLMYTFDEAVHYLDQIILMMEESKDQLTTLQYSMAKEKIDAFSYVISHLVYLEEEEAADKELEEQQSEGGTGNGRPNN